MDEVKEIKKQLDAEGIRLSSVGSPIGKIQITDDFAPHMELYKHTVDIAHAMETDYIRMFSFFMPENEDYGQYKDPVMERLGKMVDYAKANDIILLHENEKDIYGDIAPRCLEIQKAFYGEHFKAVFDFANFVQCKQDTLEAYEMMKPYVAYIHIKDALWSDASVVPPGTGDGQRIPGLPFPGASSKRFCRFFRAGDECFSEEEAERRRGIYTGPRFSGKDSGKIIEAIKISRSILLTEKLRLIFEIASCESP